MSAKQIRSPYPKMVEATFPACSVHSFIFSHPFLSCSSVVKAVNNAESAAFPAIPPEKPIFCDSQSSTAITHSRLRHDTLRLAHGIHQRYGISTLMDAFGRSSSAGPVALVHLPNCITWPVIVLGFLAAGWTITGTNPGFTAAELAHVIRECEPRVVVCHPGPRVEHVVRTACSAANHSEVDVLFVEPGNDAYGITMRSSGKNCWTNLLSEQELVVAPMSADEANQRVAFILWTSGTTGKAKGAMMSHRAVVAGLVQLWRANPGYRAYERWIAVAPFYHIFGLYNQILLAPCIGATVVVMQKFNLEGYLRLASTHKATHLHIAPPIAVALAKSDLVTQPWCSLESVVAATSGGAPLSPEIIQEVWKRLKIVIKMGYGLTETGGVTTTRGDTWDTTMSQLGSCGTPHMGVRLTIIDENGDPVSQGESGQIIIRTPAQMLGYLKNQQATAETLDERGVHTGDVGYIDGGGNLRIVERLKELIKYKGFQVSPTELEAVIAALPEVQDVAVSSTYSNAQGTELPLAYVVPRSPMLLHGLAAQERALQGFVALANKVNSAIEQNCIHYKRLRGGIFFIPEIPKSPSGKILRRLLKDQKGVHIDSYGTAGQSKL